MLQNLSDPFEIEYAGGSYAAGNYISDFVEFATSPPFAPRIELGLAKDTFDRIFWRLGILATGYSSRHHRSFPDQLLDQGIMYVCTLRPLQSQAHGYLLSRLSIPPKNP